MVLIAMSSATRQTRRAKIRIRLRTKTMAIRMTVALLNAAERDLTEKCSIRRGWSVAKTAPLRPSETATKKRFAYSK